MSGELQEAPHSGHYKRMGIEPIEVIEMWGLGFHDGNALKYLGRWREKEGLKDLEKAVWYIQRLIRLERDKNLKTELAMNAAADAKPYPYPEPAKDPGPIPAEKAPREGRTKRVRRPVRRH